MDAVTARHGAPQLVKNAADADRSRAATGQKHEGDTQCSRAATGQKRAADTDSGHSSTCCILSRQLRPFFAMPQPVATAVAQRASPCLPRLPQHSRAQKFSQGSGHGASQRTSAAVARRSRPLQSRAAAACNQCKSRAAGPANLKSPCKLLVAKHELRKLFLGGVSNVPSPQRGRCASG